MKLVKNCGLYLIAFLFSIILVHSEARAAETINARDFGVTPGVQSSQTDALHAAMKYFYDRGVAGTVYLPAGTYYVDKELRFHKGVNLVGAGIGQTVIKKMESGVNYIVGNPILPTNSIDLNVTVSNLTFDGDRTNRASKGLSQIGGMLIDQKVRNLTLDNIEIRDTTNGAILRRLQDSAIQNSVFDRTSGHSIATGAEGYPVGDFTNVEITNNLITNSLGGSGINLSRATYTTVSDNRILNQNQQSDSYGGIRIPNGGAYNTVKNNTIKNYPRGIFILSGAHHNIITGNTVIDSRIHGILVQADNNTFTNNIIQQSNRSLNPESVIRLAPGSNNVLANNEIKTYSGYNNPGIRITGASTNNQVVYNSITTGGTIVSNEAGSTNSVTGNISNGSSQFEQNAVYRLVNRNSGKLLEIANASLTDGANVQQWSSNGCTCQNWYLRMNGDGYFNIVNQNSGKALDVYNFSLENGANVVQWADVNGTNQQWQITQTGQGYYKIINRNSGKALEIHAKSNQDGGNGSQWTFNNGSNQLWQIVKVN
ncbi:RICIN domain-containing protein [Metabacillus malikii]|uniref:Parallel beta-helix repeat protein n=1 Tax=Metabacillus malikii TaxID=1504265 RepID=A0ABT9ZAM1_9BACI|nr:RICIN domain-containing protein [Metabacillus malikii]MDQ0229262.1 parallel beta-helix repeat protein [Metabacillus malikii]